MPRHKHPTAEQVIVLEGVYHLGFGDVLDRKNGIALPAGSFFVMPAGTAHYAWTESPAVVQVYGEGPWGMMPVTHAK